MSFFLLTLCCLVLVLSAMKLTRYVARITMFYHMHVMQFSFSVEKTGSSLVIMVSNGLLTALFAGEDKVIATFS